MTIQLYNEWVIIISEVHKLKRFAVILSIVMVLALLFSGCSKKEGEATGTPLEQVQAKVTTLESQVSQAINDLSNKTSKADYTTLDGEVDDLVISIDAVKANIASLTSTSATKAQITSLTSRINSLESSVNSLETSGVDLSDIEADINDNASDIDQNYDYIYTLDVQLDEMEEGIFDGVEEILADFNPPDQVVTITAFNNSDIDFEVHLAGDYIIAINFYGYDLNISEVAIDTDDSAIADMRAEYLYGADNVTGLDGTLLTVIVESESHNWTAGEEFEVEFNGLANYVLYATMNIGKSE